MDKQKLERQGLFVGFIASIYLGVKLKTGYDDFRVRLADYRKRHSEE